MHPIKIKHKTKKAIKMKKAVLTLFSISALFNFSSAQVSSYSFASSTGTYAAITGGAVLGDTTTDERNFLDPSVPLGVTTSTTTGVGFPIGFNFTYNGIVFDKLAINNNGWISLGQTSLTPHVNIDSYDYYSLPLSQTSAAIPALLRNRIGGLALDLDSQFGSELRIQTIGTTPNMVCVIQWKNYKQYGSYGDIYNFQIRLKETSNVVEVVYGTMVNSATSTDAQVGLSGTTDPDFNIRETSSNWASTTTGIANTATCFLSSTIKPASGQTFSWTPSPVCTGTPTAGTITGPTGACSGVSYNLILTGYSSNVSGLTFQWQSSSTLGGTYAPIAGATSVTYTATQTAATYYKCVVTCSGSPATTAAFSVPMNTGIYCYCTATNGGGACITNVTLGTLNRTSAACENSPSYYTSVPIGTATTTVNQGVSYPMSVTTGSSGAAILSVWIDYNQNGTFEASEWNQIATNALASTTTTINVIIPGSAVLGQTGMRIRSRSTGNPNGSGDACTAMVSGETEDYMITIGAGAACTGTPTAGTATGPASICSGVSFNLLLTGYTSGVTGITLQWQSSATLGGTYSDIVGATSPTYAGTLTASTYYRCEVVCGNGTPVYSNIVTVTLTPASGCYCTPVHSVTCSANYIDSVRIGSTTLANLHTGCTGTDGMAYTIYPATGNTTASLTGGTAYTFKITTTSSNIVSVWIDYNQNGLYEASEWTQVCITSTANIVNTATITIPANATSGLTGMRIRSRSAGSPNGSSDACTSFASGETEDYKVTIVAAPACTGTPTAGTASASDDTVCSGVNFNLVLTGYTSGVSGLTFQWQSSTDGTTYTSIIGAMTSTYQTLQTAAKYYKCLVSCSGGTPAPSNAVHVIMNDLMNCYCTSTATYVADEDIFNVTVGTLNNSSTCLTTGGVGSSLNKYSNYKAVAAPDLERNTSVPFSVQIGTCGTTPYSNAFKIFIDYNQNGSFAEAGEVVYISDTAKGGYTQTGTFTVPAAAVLGHTLMRVVNKETSDASSIDSCGTFGYGETEDYIVNITGPSGIEENTISGIAIYPNPTTGMFNITTSSADFKELQISVFDMQGKEVFSAVDKNNSTNYNKQINLEGLAKGIYYIKLNSGTGIKIQKLIMQ